MNGQWRVLRNGLGLLLLGSAALKIQWHTHTPLQLQASWFDTSGIAFPASAFELCLGGLLLVGAWSPVVRWVSISTFGVFVCVALVEALGGSKSCGCFGGSMHISPWVMAVFDSLCITLLLRCKAEIHSGVLFGLGKLGSTLVLAMITAAITTAAVWATHRPPVVVAQSSPIHADLDPFGIPSSLVLLDPEKLAGKPFLLSSHLNLGAKLQVGSWIVLLVHHDCDECAIAVPKYQAISTGRARRLAIVEMPPYATPEEPAPWLMTTGVFGKLDTTRDWFAATPVALLVKDGVVQAAVDGEAAATPNLSWWTAKK
jgi:hypothetical protein